MNGNGTYDNFMAAVLGIARHIGLPPERRLSVWQKSEEFLEVYNGSHSIGAVFTENDRWVAMIFGECVDKA